MVPATVQTDSQGQATYDYTTTEDGNISIKTVINEGGKKVASIGGYLWVTDRQSAMVRLVLLQRRPQFNQTRPGQEIVSSRAKLPTCSRSCRLTKRTCWSAPN